MTTDVAYKQSVIKHPNNKNSPNIHLKTNTNLIKKISQSLSHNRPFRTAKRTYL